MKSLNHAITRHEQPPVSRIPCWRASSHQALASKTGGVAAATAAAAAAASASAMICLQFSNLSGFIACSGLNDFEASDAMYGDGDFLAEADALEQCGDEIKQQVDWIWRTARSKYQLASLGATSPKEKAALINEAYALIKEASAKDETVHGVLLWHGVILSEWSALQGTKVKIAHLMEVKQLWERAVQLNPNDTSSLHFLGRWEHGITEIDWFSRNAANLIFGSLPATSYENALAYFTRAEEINPGFWKRNLVFMAQCEIALGHDEKAKQLLLKAKGLSNKTEEDVESDKIIAKIFKSKRW